MAPIRNAPGLARMIESLDEGDFLWVNKKAGELVVQRGHADRIPHKPGMVFIASITGCARCHCDGHKNVRWRPLTHPVEFPDGQTMTHWSPCPNNGEPILMFHKGDT